MDDKILSLLPADLVAALLRLQGQLRAAEVDPGRAFYGLFLFLDEVASEVQNFIEEAKSTVSWQEWEREFRARESRWQEIRNRVGQLVTWTKREDKPIEVEDYDDVNQLA